MERRSKSNKKFMVLSALGIFMVVDHHTFTALNLLGDYIPYNSFFMPMFVFISGYFNKIDSSTNLWAYVRKKLKTLLLPYLIVSLFVFCLQWLISWFKTGEIPVYPSGYLAYVLDRIITVGSPFMIAEPMWFVIALFSLLFAYSILKKLLYKAWNSYLAFAIFCGFHLFSVYFVKNAEFSPYLLLPLKVLFFLPFLELGILYREHFEKKHVDLSVGCKLALLFLLLFVNMIRTLYLPSAYDIAFDSLNELAGFTSPYIVTPLISSLVGILFWLTVVDLIRKPFYESRFVNYMSDNTFWIMGLHIVSFNVLNCILLLVNKFIKLPYFDVEYFRESEWYYWEIGPNFKLTYLLVGILLPLAIKRGYDAIAELCAKR